MLSLLVVITSGVSLVEIFKTVLKFINLTYLLQHIAFYNRFKVYCNCWPYQKRVPTLLHKRIEVFVGKNVANCFQPILQFKLNVLILGGVQVPKLYCRND